MPSIVCLFWLWVHICLLLLSLFSGFFGCPECGILIPQPGIEPVPPAVEAWSSNHWTSGEFSTYAFFFFQFMFQMWWFLLFYCDAKPKIVLPYRDQYITRSWKSGVGHAEHDGQLEGRVISSVTWHYTVAEEHIDNNPEELNWDVAWKW